MQTSKNTVILDDERKELARKLFERRQLRLEKQLIVDHQNKVRVQMKENLKNNQLLKRNMSIHARKKQMLSEHKLQQTKQEYLNRACTGAGKSTNFYSTQANAFK